MNALTCCPINVSIPRHGLAKEFADLPIDPYCPDFTRHKAVHRAFVDIRGKVRRAHHGPVLEKLTSGSGGEGRMYPEFEPDSYIQDLILGFAEACK